MFESIFESMRIPLFKRLLDFSAERQRCIATNIANVSTPNYKSKDVDFRAILEQTSSKSIAGLRSEERHLPIGAITADNVEAEIIASSSSDLKSGENNIDIDIEMSKSAENQLLYSATAKLMNAKFGALLKSIRGRT